MTRQNVVDFIIGEAKRLIKEEKIYELFSEGKVAKLKKVKCNLPKDVKNFTKHEAILLQDDEIPDNYCQAIAFWIHQTGIEVPDGCFFEDQGIFRSRLRSESAWGRLVSASMKKLDIFNIPEFAFFC